MPTGYTSRLCDGPQTFEEFAMGCARAFGALVALRDAPFDAPVPDEFEPSDYHAKALADAKKRLAYFKGINAAEAEKLAIAEYGKAIAHHQKTLEDNRALRDRLGAMARDVRAWAPPTPDHKGLKEFMLEQLDRTAEFDGRDFGDKPRLSSGVNFRLAAIEGAVADIARHTVEHEKEVEQCKGRSAWVRALRESLKVKA